MPCWPVSHQDGIYVVTDSDGITYPITIGRMPVKILQPGWYPTGLQTGLKPFHLLELRNDNGPDRDAVWYLADDLEFICNRAASLLPEHARQVTTSLQPLLRDIHQQAIRAPQAAVAPSSRAFDGINPGVTRDLIGFVVDTALTPPEIVSLGLVERISAQYTKGELTFSVALLAQTLELPAPKQILEGLTLASPFDGSLLFAQDQFVPETGSGEGLIDQAYRFQDPNVEITLYLLIHAGGPALYIPAINTVFATTPGLTGGQVLSALLSYYASNTDRLESRQAAFEPVPAQVEYADASEPRNWLDRAALSDEDQPMHAAKAPSVTWWKRLLGKGQA